MFLFVLKRTEVYPSPVGSRTKSLYVGGGGGSNVSGIKVGPQNGFLFGPIRRENPGTVVFPWLHLSEMSPWILDGTQLNRWDKTPL